jgi:hypothetical protein
MLKIWNIQNKAIGLAYFSQKKTILANIALNCKYYIILLWTPDNT